MPHALHEPAELPPRDWLQSWLVVAYAVAGSLVWNYAVRPLEETDLEGRFGAEFKHYRRTVRCWLPRLPASRRTTRAMSGNCAAAGERVEP
ncbi:steroid 5-alpha reductase family enzyme [Arthrobacter sp. MP_2.3]